MKTKQCFVSAVLTCALGYTTSGYALEGFEPICTLDESCAVEKSTLVAFATPALTTYKTLSGNFVCSPATFELANEDSLSNAEALCHVMAATAGPSSSSSSSGADTQATSAAISAGSFALVSLSNGKALALQSGDGGERIVQQGFRQRPHQIWQVTPLDNGYYSITVPGTDLALESKNWDTRDGAKLHNTSWINSWNQHWQIEDNGKGALSIRSRLSNQALDVYPVNNQNSGDVVLWTYWGGDNQHWRLVPIELASESQPVEP